MKKVEEIENQVQDLSPEDLAAFREWFAEFDAESFTIASQRLARRALQSPRAL